MEAAVVGLQGEAFVKRLSENRKVDNRRYSFVTWTEGCLALSFGLTMLLLALGLIRGWTS